jgi:hypothetical protein
MRTRSTAFDALNAFLLSIGINRIEAIQRELFGCRAKAGRFTHQPVRASLITRSGGAMKALQIPCCQPNGRAGRSVVGQAPIGTV